MARMLYLYSCLLAAVALGTAPPVLMLPPGRPAALPEQGFRSQISPNNAKVIVAPVANAGSTVHLAPRLRGQSSMMPAHASSTNLEGTLIGMLKITPPSKFAGTHEAQFRQHVVSVLSHTQTASITERASSLGSLFIAALAVVVAGGHWCRQRAQTVTNMELSTEMASDLDRPKFAVAAVGGDEAQVAASGRGAERPTLRVDELQHGVKYRGAVSSILDFGAFVDIGAERNGLLRASEVTTESGASIYDILEQGQEVDVWISSVKPDGKFSITTLGSTPGTTQGSSQDWTPFVDTPPDRWLDGVVRDIVSYGAFVQVTLESGEQAQGLLHRSKMRHGFVEVVESELAVGQEVKVRILNVDWGANRMSLSMRAVHDADGEQSPPPDMAAFKDTDPDEWLTGRVQKLVAIGAWIRATAPGGEHEADGLVHITQISDAPLARVDEALRVGEEVRVRVLSVDSDGKMSLSMKERFSG